MKAITIKSRMLVGLTTAALCLSMTSCTNVAQNGVSLPTDGHADTMTTTVTTAATTFTTTATPTDAPTDPTSAPTSAPLAPTTEYRSPNVTYFVAESAAVDASFFDDAVFVGDSVSLKLTNYHLSTAALGNAAFLTSGSLGVANAMWDVNREDAVHPSYQGETVTVVDGIAKTGRNKVYFMLGINDLGLYGVEETFNNFKTITDDILRTSPGVTMYIQSVTPMLEDFTDLTNARINEYNALVSEYCREKGWYFVDVASVLRTADGTLPYDYCSDPDNMGIHFNDVACEVWVNYLYTHTGR
ncbi:MAG: hypothetical protein IJB27_06780 [Clostridia bacterium]|nr:hypothetical protein [Clostridia bacterium]